MSISSYTGLEKYFATRVSQPFSIEHIMNFISMNIIVKWFKVRRTAEFSLYLLPKSYTGSSNRDIIVAENVISFLKMTKMLSILIMHHVCEQIRNNGVKFWDNDIWPGNSLGLNAAEHIGTIY